MNQEQTLQENNDFVRLGYNIEISDEEMPKTKEDWDKLYAQEKNLRKQIRQKLFINLGRVDLNELVQALKDYQLTQIVIDWANIHRRMRAMLIKKGGINIAVVSTSEILLEAADVLKKN
ncbi:MAG: hypothetical protein CO138_01650 [Candidatus Moranbacteria bacterium CG_4_9_14_3_um_filter_33_15]|nr:MAG: hypothetical protein COT31_02150 [Candidatus Moranbacteria bacterium CG08_land_8_20_14_0_20_34_16]PJA89221.1 MAG: hypothetical protein CO138_01650 [Candidatus Moranbacteria bacterium CG_4_9_14_3_um_filter_33_15]